MANNCLPLICANCLAWWCGRGCTFKTKFYSISAIQQMERRRELERVTSFEVCPDCGKEDGVYHFEDLLC